MKIFRLKLALNIELINLSIKYNTSLPKLVLGKKEGPYIGHYDYLNHVILLDPNKLHGQKEFFNALYHEFRHHWQWTHKHRDYMWWMDHYDELYKELYWFAPIEIDARLFASNEGSYNGEVFDLLPIEKVEQAYQQGSLMNACKSLADGLAQNY